MTYPRNLYLVTYQKNNSRNKTGNCTVSELNIGKALKRKKFPSSI